MHSYEEAFCVLEGLPRLSMGGETAELAPHQCGLIPAGASHARRNGRTQSCRWLDMLAPSPRDPGKEPPDTFFTPEPDNGNAPRLLDVRDPRCRHFFPLDDGQMDVDRLKRGSAISEPTVFASMATALLAYSGIAVKMLVDQRLGGHLLTMFMVECQPGGVAYPHDHPFEEAHFMPRLLQPDRCEGAMARDLRAAAAPEPLVPFQSRLGSSGPAAAATLRTRGTGRAANQPERGRRP